MCGTPAWEHGRNATRPRGFTLVELLLVVVISLTASGLAAVAFQRSFRATRIRVAARDVIAMGRYARAVAVLEERTVRLDLDLETGRIRLLRAEAPPTADAFRLAEEPNAARSPEAFLPVDRARRLPDGVRIVAMEGGRPGEPTGNGDLRTLHFHPSGLSDDAEIDLEDTAGRRMRLRLEGDAGRWKVDP